MKYLKEQFKTTISAINSIKINPINAICYLLPITISLVSIIGFIVALIVFCINNGFGSQIDIVKENLLLNAKMAFTSGTVDILISNTVLTIISLLFLAEIICLTFLFYKTESKNKKILLSVLLIISLVFIGIYFFATMIAGGKIPLSENKAIEIYKFFYNNGVSQSITNARMVLLVGLVSLILFGTVLFFSKYRTAINATIISLAFSFIFSPLLLLLIENIIPLFLGIIALTLCGGILFCIGRVIWGSLEFAVSNSDSGSASKEKSASSKTKSEKPTPPPKEEKNCAYIPQYNELLGNKLWKIKGVFHDYIANDNGAITREICSLEDFRKGKFKIYDKKTGREIKDSEIKWKN